MISEKKMEKVFMPIPVETREYCEICDEMKTSVYKCVHQAPPLETRRKLLVLCFIAGLALFSICLIAEELISRKLSREKRPSSSLVQDSLPLGPRTSERGLLWSEKAEAVVPPGFSDTETEIVMKSLREKPVEETLSKDWLHCGMEYNRIVRFADGSQACSKNREARFMQGEILAFYLARFLGMKNTPAVVLSELSSEQWGPIGTFDASWNETAGITALIQWIPNLEKSTISPLIRERILPEEGQEYLRPLPLSGQSTEIEEMSDDQLSNTIQWGDLIIFDYLTGNYDRVVSMQDAARRENRSSILMKAVPNFARSTDTSSIWLIDNDSSFVSAYPLMYEGKLGEIFLNFHARALGSLCIFRRRTIERLRILEDSGDEAFGVLLRLIRKNEPLFDALPEVSSLDSVFSRRFRERINEVMGWFRWCRGRTYSYRQ